MLNKEWKVEEKEASIWRYRGMLPIDKGVSLGEGITPVRRVMGVQVKDETRNPTGSYADRGSTVLTSVLRPSEVNLIFERDLTLSISEYLRASGSRVRVSVDPEDVDLIELLYLANTGADITFDKIRPSFSYHNPLMLEGFKTLAYELYEQLNPKGVVLPAETGFLGYSVVRGFQELEELGLISSPQVILAAHEEADHPMLDFVQGLGARVVRVKARDALYTLLSLSKAGVVVKPVSAMAYHVSKSTGYVAVLTATGMRKVPKLREKSSHLQEKVIKSLSEGEKTAYQIWKELKGATLQGVYLALNRLVSERKVRVRHVMRGKRKVALYSLNDC